MPIRKIPLVNDEVYHVYNKSIAGFKIFNDDSDYSRMMELMSFYIAGRTPCKFSVYKMLKNIEVDFSNKNADIIAYCLMPTHIHFILKQTKNSGIGNFVGLVSQSYSRYFNIRHRRKGPLWEARFNNVLIKDDEQLLHLTRYIHLNPVSASLVKNPGDWKYSSYKEYIEANASDSRMCNYYNFLKIEPDSYKKFVLDQMDYQKRLAIIKNMTLDD